jgi:hypothetical protein
MGEAKRRKQLDQNFGKNQIEDFKIISTKKFIDNHKQKLINQNKMDQMDKKEMDDLINSLNFICFIFKYKNQESGGMYMIYEDVIQLFKNKQNYLSVEGDQFKFQMNRDIDFNVSKLPQLIKDKIFYAIDSHIAHLIYGSNDEKEFTKMISNMIDQEMNLYQMNVSS